MFMRFATFRVIVLDEMFLPSFSVYCVIGQEGILFYILGIYLSYLT